MAEAAAVAGMGVVLWEARRLAVTIIMNITGTMALWAALRPVGIITTTTIIITIMIIMITMTIIMATIITITILCLHHPLRDRSLRRSWACARGAGQARIALGA